MARTTLCDKCGKQLSLQESVYNDVRLGAGGLDRYQEYCNKHLRELRKMIRSWIESD